MSKSKWRPMRDAMAQLQAAAMRARDSETALRLLREAEEEEEAEMLLLLS